MKYFSILCVFILALSILAAQKFLISNPLYRRKLTHLTIAPVFILVLHLQNPQTMIQKSFLASLPFVSGIYFSIFGEKKLGLILYCLESALLPFLSDNYETAVLLMVFGDGLAGFAPLFGAKTGRKTGTGSLLCFVGSVFVLIVKGKSFLKAVVIGGILSGLERISGYWDNLVLVLGALACLKASEIF
ncbi:Hypothetical_protein [Hexamita inflata]|uniref:Hypothetical_protein n=1 Tax=Hexamita inflata TaxID=28002 RepID=A0AA86QPK4_9EUKA|nr:Hypothetical protein HINF_LOCUS47081 [Hexamita inflata]